MAIKKYNWTTYFKESSYPKGTIKHLTIVFMLLPLLANAQMQNTPILTDPMQNTVFSFYPFESEGLTWNHKDYFHSLINVTGDPYGGMWFRMMLPPDFEISDTDKKYPLILFFHGSGERGTTNYRQLVHGGVTHRNAVTDGEFPGILLYPQQNTSGGGWPANGNDQIADRAFLIVRKLIQYYNVDPNRIYVHGLSGGGEGTWQVLYYYPELIAAALPMSAARTEYVDPVSTREKFAHIPIWQSQGGRDSRPTPLLGNYGVNVLRDYGASIRYSFMPTTGHGTWNTMYSKPDFFSWMLQYSKTSIHAFYEQTEFCTGEQIQNLKLGVTAGFDGYEWALNDTINNVFGSGLNEITANSAGTYYVRIRRGSDWTYWSLSELPIGNTRAPSPPTVISSGNASVTLPALDGSTSVNLFETGGPSINYHWYKDDITVAGATNDNYTVTQEGDYTLTVKSPAESGVEYFDYWDASDWSPGQDGILDEYPAEFRAESIGCESTPSNIIRVTTVNGPNSPLVPINFFVFSRGPGENELIWDDNSDNETGFEIYRSEDGGINYDLISIQPASDGSASIIYSDFNVLSSTQYCYRIRAVNGGGGSPYTEMACASTTVDTTPPVSPVLWITSKDGSSISLSWVSSDNVGIVGYDLYRNGSLLASLTQSFYNDINLPTSTLFTYYVIAKDAAGNSSTSNQITAATSTSGLYYRYYHFGAGQDLTTVDDIESTTLIKSGKADNFDISLRERDDRFGFIFEGYIQIPTSGTWRFYPYSDDGSQVYIDGELVYNNDGPHGCDVYGSAISRTLSAGPHQIKVLYFENTGGECLDVRWRYGWGSTTTIPDSALEEDFNYPSGPNAPSNFTANAISYNQIDLSWTDNSNNETGFELYRSAVDQSAYELITVLGAGIESYSDDELLPTTTYYYKILAKNNLGVSDFDYANAQTQSAPTAPTIPSDLTATPISESSISLSWSDDSNNEVGFEIYRATYDIVGNYLLIATTAPDVTMYLDSGLPGGTTFYYKIRAKGIVNNSPFTSPVNTATLNNPPVITTTIPDRSVQIGTILEFEVQATDPDQNTVTFSTADGNWPSFGTVTNIGQNRALVRFENPTIGDEGDYILRLSATDGIYDVYSNYFTITVNNNAVPVFTTIGDQQMNDGESLTINISATDDGNLVLSEQNLPPFAVWNYSGSGGTASIDFDPIVGQAGYYPDITIIANDGQGGISEEKFNLLVNAIETSYLLNISFDNVPRFSAPWNFIGGTNLAIGANDIWPIGNLLTANQSSTAITIDATEINVNSRSFNNTFSFGNNGPGIQGVGVLPDNVIKNGLAGENNENNKLVLNGLNDILSYEINLVSSVRPEYAGQPYTTTFRINGVSKTINPVGNAAELQRFVDVRPTNGTIEIEMLTSGGSRTMLNAFTLEAYYDDGTIPLAPSNLVLEAQSSSSILIGWNDNSTNETDFDIYRRAEAEGTFSLVGSVNKNINSFLDQSGINGTTRYYYYIQARNNNGFANSGTLDVISLNASPIIAQLNSFTVKTGQRTYIPVSATDYENDPITLFFENVPAFVSFIDNGNGTGNIILDPDESVVNQSFELELLANDSRGGASSMPFFFDVSNGNYLQTIYLNLTQNGVLEGSGWNNLTANPATYTTPYVGINDINGNPTTIGLTLSGTWTGQAAEGLTYLEEAIFPENVMEAFWFTTGVGQITLTGLDPAYKYNIMLFSSTDAPGIQTTVGIIDYPENDLSTTSYTSGAVSVGVDAYKNPNKPKKLSGLSPDSGGNISFIIQGSGGVRAVLNALILEKYENETISFAPSNVVSEVISAPYTESAANPAPFHVELNWVDNSGIETGYEIARYDYSSGTSSIITTTSANAQYYKDTNLPRDHKFGYRIRAISPTGVSEFSSTVDVTIPIYRILMNVNYYSTDDVDIDGWNNTSITPDPGLDLDFENLVNDENVATSIALNTLQWGAYAGTIFTGVNSDGLYPSNATKSYWQLEPGDVDVFEWAGLDDALKYNLIFFGSRIAGGVPQNGRGFYTIGSSTIMFNSWYNLNRSIQFKNISPDQGRIEFSATEDGGIPVYAYINVLELQPMTDFDLAYPTQDFVYYAAESSDINTLTNWFDSPDESGGNPSSFSEQGLKYVIADEKVTNLANDLTIGGIGSKMILKDNVVINFTAGNLTLNLPYLEIDEGASVTFGGSGLSTATINIGDRGLNIRNGATLDIGNAVLNVTGEGAINPANTNGVIASDGGAINIVNESIESNNLYFADGSNLTSLKIDNSNLATLTLNDTIRITDKLEVTNGHLITNGYIKLISDATNTAMIPPVGPTSTITGAVEYQRYWARSKGGYYYIGVPVQDQTLADWQTDFFIQGVEGRYPTYWTNVYTFNEPTNAWSAMNNITNPVEPGRGITALMFNSDFADGFIRYSNTGDPVYGTFKVNLSYTDRGAPLEEEGWQLVANPYACAIDLNSIDWDNDADGLGTSVYLWNGATSMYDTWNPELNSRAIASGQGFFVKADGTTTNPYIDFREEHKIVADPAFLRTSSPTNLLTFKMINQDSIADRFYIAVNESATFEFESRYDAFKYKNSSHNLYGTDPVGNKLAINSIPALRAQDTLLLNVESAASKSYKFQVTGLGSLDQPVNIYLTDHYPNSTRLLNEGEVIPFTIDKNVNGSFGQRFSLVIGQPGVVKLKNTIARAGKAFKMPLSLGQLENVAEMTIGVQFNASEFKLNSVKLLNALQGVIVDTTSAREGIITLTKNSGTGILTLPDVSDVVEFEFRPLINRTGMYSIWIDPALSVKTSESAKYTVLATDATIDLRRARKLKGNILDLKGRPFNNAVVRLKSHFDTSTTSPVNGSFNFDIMDNLAYDVEVAPSDLDYSDPDLLDLIQITRYVNELEQIPSKQILYSSDLNNDGKVNVTDLAQLQTLILSKQDKHPGRTIFNLHTRIGGDYATRQAAASGESSGAVSFVADEDYVLDFLASRKGEVFQNRSNIRENGNDVNILFDLIPDSRKYDILHLNLYMEKDMELAGFELHMSVENSGFEIIGVENQIDQSLSFDEFHDNTKSQLGVLYISLDELSHTITNEKPFLTVSLKQNSSLQNDDIIQVNNDSKIVGSGFQINSISGITPRDFGGYENSILTLYPNPSNGQLNAVINSSEEDNYKFMFINASGQILFEEVRHVYKGTNTINFTLATNQQYLAPGYYLMRTENSRWTDVKPFIIKH
jgi:predicted esterase